LEREILMKIIREVGMKSGDMPRVNKEGNEF